MNPNRKYLNMANQHNTRSTPCSYNTGSSCYNPNTDLPDHKPLKTLIRITSKTVRRMPSLKYRKPFAGFDHDPNQRIRILARKPSLRPLRRHGFKSKKDFEAGEDPGLSIDRRQFAPSRHDWSGNKTSRVLARKPNLKPSRKHGFKSKKALKVSQGGELSVGRATCSSKIKDYEFPDSKSVLELKVCRYRYCCVSGHDHSYSPPLKTFLLSRKTRLLKSQKSLKFRGSSIMRKSGLTVDKPPVNSKEKYEIIKELPHLEHFSQSSGGDKISNNNFHTTMWQLLASRLALELQTHQVLEPSHEEQVEEIQSSEDLYQMASDFGTESQSEYDQNNETDRIAAVKLVQEAVDTVFPPEIDDRESDVQSVTSEKSEEGSGDFEKSKVKSEEKLPKRWNIVKNRMLLKRFVKELQKSRKLDPLGRQNVSVDPEERSEKVFLKHQIGGERRNAEEWLLDYALQQVVAKLTPARKRKVELLVEAFETIAPIPKVEGLISGKACKGETEQERSADNVKLKEDFSDTESESSQSSRAVDKILGDEQNSTNMWSILYQTAMSRIAEQTQLNGAEYNKEIVGDSKNDQDGELSQTDAIKMVKEAVDSIFSSESEISSKELETAKLKADDPASEPPKRGGNNWDKLKRVMLLKRFVKEVEKSRTEKFNPMAPHTSPPEPGSEEEKVFLRHKMMGEKRSGEVWMLDYALQQAVAELTPARKRRVSLLVQAFETVNPTLETKS